MKEYLIIGLFIILLPSVMNYLRKRHLVKYKWSNLITKAMGATAISVLFAISFKNYTHPTDLTIRIILTGILFIYFIYQMYEGVSNFRHND